MATKKWIRNIDDPYQQTVARLIDKVKFNKNNECWEWMASKDKDGYGTFQYSGPTGLEEKTEKRRAHRVSYVLFIGDIDKNDVICHSCDNPSCINPKHLFKGSHYDNIMDRVLKNRSATGISHGLVKNPEIAKLIGEKKRRKVIYNNIQITAHELADLTGVPLSLIIGRLDRGFSAERAVSQPYRKTKKKHT